MWRLSICAFVQPRSLYSHVPSVDVRRCPSRCRNSHSLSDCSHRRPGHSIDVSSWAVQYWGGGDDALLQTDNHSCGIFVLAYSFFWLRERRLPTDADFDTPDLLHLRRFVGVTLAKSVAAFREEVVDVDAAAPRPSTLSSEEMHALIALVNAPSDAYIEGGKVVIDLVDDD